MLQCIRDIWRNGLIPQVLLSNTLLQVIHSSARTLIGSCHPATPPPSGSLMQTLCAHHFFPPAELLPLGPFFSLGRTSASLLQPQPHRVVTFSCLDLPPPSAELWFRILERFRQCSPLPCPCRFLFPLSGKISSLMKPTICVQPPAAEPYQESHTRARWFYCQRI